MKANSESPETLYADLAFPEAPDNRPYVYINMVATIDGKIVSGTRDDHVLDLGSKTDHLVMARIERASDAILLGAGTLRVNPPQWRPRARIKVVVSASGRLPFESAFFHGTDTLVATSEQARFHVPDNVHRVVAGEEQVDLRQILRRLRCEWGVRRLLVLGGSELNAQLLALNLVDELFLTVAPKIKLGRGLPTYADGAPLEREKLQHYSLIEHHALGDEIFIRYRRTHDPAEPTD